MGFVVGMAGWGFILFEIFAGEAGSVAADGDKVNQYVKSSFNTMRLIVTAGWCIYPLGCFFGYLMGAVNDDALNLVYNLADFVNKIGFLLGHLAGRQGRHYGEHQQGEAAWLRRGCVRSLHRPIAQRRVRST